MNPEKSLPHEHRNNQEVSKSAEQATERLKNELDKAAEKSPGARQERVEKARHEAREVFSSEPSKEAQPEDAASIRAIRRVTATEKKQTYKKTMKAIRTEMTPAARGFSKLIHNPVIEKASDFAGGTIARPNAILAGSVAAFLLVTGVYLLARHYGYQLSGFETIGAFILGWALGLIYDYARVTASGRR